MLRHTPLRQLFPIAAATLCLSAGARADVQTVTVTYNGSQPAKPSSLKFRVGDRLTLKTRAEDLAQKLVGRTVRTDATIHYTNGTRTYEREVSSTGCGFLWCCACKEEVHEAIRVVQPVWDVRTTEYLPFLQVGPALVFTTASGTKAMQLSGADGSAREALVHRRLDRINEA